MCWKGRGIIDYIKLGKISPNSKGELSNPEQLVENLQSLIGQKFPLTGKPRTDESNFRKMITNHLLSKHIPNETVEYEIVPPKQRKVLNINEVYRWIFLIIIKDRLCTIQLNKEGRMMAEIDD